MPNDVYCLICNDISEVSDELIIVYLVLSLLQVSRGQIILRLGYVQIIRAKFGFVNFQGSSERMNYLKFACSGKILLLTCNTSRLLHIFLDSDRAMPNCSAA